MLRPTSVSALCSKMPALKLFLSGLFLAPTVLACSFISGWVSDSLRRFNADSSEAS